MIFVTVGTHYQGFERLIKKMDEIAAELEEEVVIQVGHTDYEPRNAEWFEFKNPDIIVDFYKDADIIVAHAGAGTLLDALYFEKTIIVVPRLKKYGEHIDDQQLELAEALEELGKAVAVYDTENLGSLFKNIKKRETTFKVNNGLSNYIKNFMGGAE